MNQQKKTGILLLGVFGAVMVALTIFTLAVTRSERAYPNLTIGDVPVGGLTREEIGKVLEENGWTAQAETPMVLRSYCGATSTVSPVLVGVMPGPGRAAEYACRYGKEGTLIDNFAAYLRCRMQGTDLNTDLVRVDYTYLDGRIDELQTILNEKTATDAFEVSEDLKELIICKGYGSELELLRDNLTERIVDALNAGDTIMDVLDLANEISSPDFSQLSLLACAGASDASFSTDGSHEIVPEQDGWQFDAEVAGQVWSEAQIGEPVRIPLTAVKADVTAKDLESKMYIHLLGAMTTKYNNSNENRSSNVRLATSLVNGTVIFPGEEFSFNDTVGKRTEEAGFLMAPAYAGYGDIQEELGGGVCQVSTGIYASALFAFLEITAHTCHIYPPNYIQLGTDATVSIPENSGRSIDMKFRNSKSFPIRIVGYCEETVHPDTGKPQKRVTIEIWGTLEDGDYMPVEFDNAWGDVYDYDRIIEPAYEDRQGYRIQFTHDEAEFEDETGKGLRTLTYRRVYDESGTVVEKKILNREYDFGYGMDTYYYKQ